jgi:regulator of protease activity HflC (stomatin/prohibitin superfamily)
MKDVELPVAMQEVMAMQAQAIREKRSRIIKAEAELEASKKLASAAEQMAASPVAVELRRMQMVTEVGAENNSTTVMMIPSDFVTLSKSLTEYLREHKTAELPSQDVAAEHVALTRDQVPSKH